MQYSDIPMEVISKHDELRSVSHVAGAKHLMFRSLATVSQDAAGHTKDQVHLGLRSKNGLHSQSTWDLKGHTPIHLNERPAGTLQTLKVLSSDEAERLPPIMNLIYYGHLSSLEGDLRLLQPRLHPDSTILLHCRGLGIIE